MELILFSNKKGVLSSIENGGTWSHNPENALVVNDIFDKRLELNSIYLNNDEHSKWMKKNEINTFSYGEALYQLITIINSTQNIADATQALKNITGLSWEKNKSLWVCENESFDKEQISKKILENALSKEVIAKNLNLVGQVNYWTDETRNIYSIPSKEVMIYKAKAGQQISGLLSLTEKYISKSTDQDSIYHADKVYEKINELKNEISNLQQHQIKRQNHTIT